MINYPKSWLQIRIFLLLIISAIYAPALPKKARFIRANNAFGKTHFIKGISNNTVQKILQTKPIHRTNTNGPVQVLFAPDDNLQKEIIKLINNEQTNIKIAIYLFTNKKIAEALVNADKRGVKVELIVDGTNAYSRHSKINLLKNKSSIFVCEYHAKPDYNGNAESIMHNKFIIFKNNKKGKSLVWTGSYNFTVRANTKNQENAIISDDPTLIQHFEKQFDRLKRRCSQSSH